MFYPTLIRRYNKSKLEPTIIYYHSNALIFGIKMVLVLLFIIHFWHNKCSLAELSPKTSDYPLICIVNL